MQVLILKEITVRADVSLVAIVKPGGLSVWATPGSGWSGRTGVGLGRFLALLHDYYVGAGRRTAGGSSGGVGSGGKGRSRFLATLGMTIQWRGRLGRWGGLGCTDGVRSFATLRMTNAGIGR